MTNPHIGSSLDEFLEEEGILGEVYTIAIKRVLVFLTTRPTPESDQGATEVEIVDYH